MLNTPLIEIELQPDSTRVPRRGREKTSWKRIAPRPAFSLWIVTYLQNQGQAPRTSSPLQKNNSAIRPIWLRFLSF